MKVQIQTINPQFIKAQYFGLKTKELGSKYNFGLKTKELGSNIILVGKLRMHFAQRRVEPWGIRGIWP